MSVWPKIQLALECGHVVNDFAPKQKSSKRVCWRCRGNPRRRVVAPTAAEVRALLGEAAA